MRASSKPSSDDLVPALAHHLTQKEPQVDAEEQQVRFLCSFSLTFFVASIPYTLFCLVIGLRMGCFVGVVVCSLYAFSWRLAIRGFHKFSQVVFLATAYVSACIGTLHLGNGSGIPVFLIALGCIWIVLEDRAHFGNPFYCVFVFSITVITWLFLNSASDKVLVIRESSLSLSHVNYMLYPLNHVLCIVLVCGFVMWLKTAKMKRERDLALECRLVDKIVLGLLPSEIVERLKQGERLIADWHPLACVLFMDIVGFTEIASMLTPKELVVGVMQVFEEVEAVVKKFPCVEKIKTIGDAFMCASGLTDQEIDVENLISMAKLALILRNSAFQMAFVDGSDKAKVIPMSFRFGINCGGVVAGVLSKKRFAYDVMGDTVNVASRMESLSQAGKILVTDTFKVQLQEFFEFENGGMVNVKGKGPMQVWFLEKEKLLQV